MTKWMQAREVFETAQRAYHDALIDLGEHRLSVHYAHVMIYLLDGEMGASALAEKSGFVRTTFTPIVDRLIDLGYVERHVNPHDRRAVLLALTDSGRKITRKICAAFAKVDGELVE